MALTEPKNQAKQSKTKQSKAKKMYAEGRSRTLFHFKVSLMNKRYQCPGNESMAIWGVI